VSDPRPSDLETTLIIVVISLIFVGMSISVSGCRSVGPTITIRNSPLAVVTLWDTKVEAAQGKSVPIDLARGASASWGKAAGTVAGAALGAAVAGPGGAGVGGAVGGPIVDAAGKLLDDPTEGVQIEMVPGE
jgi:hypothetical protein